MSKKHFIELANVIIHARKANPKAYPQAELEDLAAFCKRVNSAFKRDRWLAYIAGECGPSGGKPKAA